jgi:two-component system CheB/CheR fusion protein
MQSHSASALKEHEASRMSARRFKILLIEDHSDIAEALSILLTQEGHEVQIATDVASGLNAALHHRCDLMLSDLGLPDGAGTDLMRQLRATGNTLPGIALSGYDREQDVRRSLQVGFAAHLIKPVELHQLKTTISAVMARAVSGSS